MPELSASAPALVWLRAKGNEAKETVYSAGRLVGHEHNGRARVQLDSTDKTGTVIAASSSDVLPRNGPGTRPDSCQLLHLNEACVLENIAARFADGDIYTWTSHVLTAVNPYEELPLYADDLVRQLPTLAPRNLPPHAFSVAELAVRNVRKGAQAVVVSGESGAGKTVTMSHVMTYITRRTPNAGGSDGDLGLRLGHLLLKSNPVLEAFGNAQTVRNHNSSRFGKFIKVAFDPSGTRMCGMELKTYLLEKTRVVSFGPGERTYHVFYALLAGASTQQSERWGLRTKEDHILTARASDSDAAVAEGTASKFTELRVALSALTVRQEEQADILGLVSSIMHLCDVRFVPLEDSSDGGCRPVGSAALSHAVKLLGCPSISLKLIQRVIRSPRGGADAQEPITVPLSAEQASAARDALCKAVYLALFDHICRRFNEAASLIGAQLRHVEQKQRAKAGLHISESRAQLRRHHGNNDAEKASPIPLASPPGPTSLGSAYEANYAEKPWSPPAAGASPAAILSPAAVLSPASGASADCEKFIGLLDMFGFETFAVNSLEQVRGPAPEPASPCR